VFLLVLVILWLFVRLIQYLLLLIVMRTARIRIVGASIAAISTFSVAGLMYAQSNVSSQYTECVAPHIRQYEQSLLDINRSYADQHLSFMEQRGQARINAWSIPERSQRSRAIRDADRSFRDALRDLNRWLRDQERDIRNAFRDAEDSCDDQYDNDIDGGESVSSRSFSSFRFSSPSSFQFSSFKFSSFPSNNQMCGNGRCEPGEGYVCQPCQTFGCVNSCYVGSCPQDCGIEGFSSSSRSSFRFSSFRSSSRSSSSTWIFKPHDASTQQMNTNSCECQTVCDPSGSPCMAVCPAQC
jgi:hypothetical protein